jgi:acyl-CoA thioester hydrolase
MPRPDPWRLNPGAYPFTDTLQTRFADLDVLGHINNVAMLGLFETGRTRFMEAVKLVRWRRPRWLVASQTVNYLAEGGYPADIAMHHGIGRVGGRSWDVLALAVQDGRAVATADVTVVIDAPAIGDDFGAALNEWAVSP